MSRRHPALALALLCGATGCRAGFDAVIPPARPVTRVAVETQGAGWTRVGADELIAAGLDADAPAATLAMSREGAAVAFTLEHDQPLLADVSALLFWAEPARSRWTDTAVYWVADGNEPGARIEDRAAAPMGAAAEPLRARTEKADELFYVLSLQNGPETNFVWDGAVATTGPVSKSFTIDATRPVAGAFTLAVDLHGLTGYDAVAPDHHAVFEVNGHVAGDVTFDGSGDTHVEVTGDAAWLVDGANTVTLRLPHDTGAIRDTILVRSMTLEHPRASTMADPLATAVVEAAAPGTYVIDGVAANTEVFDLADPAAPVRVVAGSAAAFAPPIDDEDKNEGDTPAPPPRLTIRVDAAPARFLVAPPASAREPLAVRAERGARVPALPWNGDELVIVAPEDLAPAAERLAEHRRSQGISVHVLDWGAVADSFGDGVPGPDAIRALVLGNRVAVPPRWLLLFGDASYDPKERLTTDEPSGHRLPTFFDDVAGLMEAPSDNAIVAASSGGAPEIAVGRIPAATIEEADAVVDKLIAYDAAPIPAQPRVILAADDGVESWEVDLFENTSEGAASLVPQTFTTDRVYVSTLGAATARTELLARLGDGALFVNYLGHGNYTEWANEKILMAADVAALPSQDVLPVYTVMNCLTGHFSQPNWKVRSLGELLLVTPGRGAIAVVASSAMAYPGGQAELDLALAQRLLADSSQPALGDAFLDAKSQLDPGDVEQRVVLQSWHLLGDPSMRIKRP